MEELWLMKSKIGYHNSNANGVAKNNKGEKKNGYGEIHKDIEREYT